MKGVVENAVTKRVAGEQPSRLQAFVTAGIAGVATGVAVYKLLRSGGSAGDNGSRS